MNRTLINKIAQLSDLPITPTQAAGLADDFATSLAVVDQLFAIDAKGAIPTYQVNDLENVCRADVVNEETQFTQEQALANAQRQHQGFFVVGRLIDHEA